MEQQAHRRYFSGGAVAAYGYRINRSSKTTELESLFLEKADSLPRGSRRQVNQGNEKEKEKNSEEKAQENKTKTELTISRPQEREKKDGVEDVGLTLSRSSTAKAQRFQIHHITTRPHPSKLLRRLLI